MHKRLISFGDSFVFGNELQDYESGSVPYSRLTYPALIAQSYGMEYLCLAKPAASNQYIAKKILEYPYNGSEFCLVQWTFSSRFGIPLEHEYITQKGAVSDWFDMRPHQIDQTENIPEQLQTLSKDFYTHTNIDQFSKLQSQMCIDTCHARLDSLGIDHVFYCLDDDLLGYSHISTFDDMSFLAYCDQNKLTKTKQGHITAQGHEFVFSKVQSSIFGQNK